MEMPKKTYTNKKIGEILIEQGLITPQQLKEALEEQKNGNNKRLGEIFVEAGIISKEELYEVLQYVFETEYVDLSNYVIDPEVISLIPEKIALQFKLIPISKNDDELIIAMANPLDVYAIDFVRSHTKIKKIKSLLAPEEDILNTITSYYELGEYDDIIEKLGTEIVFKEEEEQGQTAVLFGLKSAPKKNIFKRYEVNLLIDHRRFIEVVRIFLRDAGQLIGRVTRRGRPAGHPYGLRESWFPAGAGGSPPAGSRVRRCVSGGARRSAGSGGPRGGT